MSIHNNIWWGAPKKFTAKLEERKISWLELFYDLVYVIVISRTTHLLVINTSLLGIVDYIYLFSIIFWGWYNGSQYYDLHGAPGIRTRFMTLWQMIAVASLAVTLDSPPDKLLYRTTISIAFLQGYITYLWWSVGIYDKEHRKLNVPYTICYLLSLGLILTSLFVQNGEKRIFFWTALALNYLPPVLAARGIQSRGIVFTLSTSMVERLGLMVIIVFGEAILGVINGMSGMKEVTITQWLCFGLGILITFGLWWIFFSIIADRESKTGYAAGMTMSAIYIPAISSLGMTGAYFPAVIAAADPLFFLLRSMYGISLSVFLLTVVAMSRFLVYPPQYIKAKKLLQPIILIAAGLISSITLLLPAVSPVYYLLAIFIVFLAIIVVITNRWYRVETSKTKEDDGIISV